MIERIAGIVSPGIAPVGGAGGGTATPGLGGTSFGDTLKHALGEISGAQDAADQTVQAYLRGDQVELHEVMASAAEAGIAIEMLVEIRNKLTEAYRTVLQMQS